MRIVIPLVVLAVWVAAPTSGQMMGEKMPCQAMQAEQGMPMSKGMGMEMGTCPQCRMGDPLRAICRVDLEALGLSADQRKALEDRRFELRKTVIRKRAELSIQRLELERMIGDRGFDLSAAEAAAKAMSTLEGEIQSAHLGFLHDLASQLSEDQWQKLQKAGSKAMMPMMGVQGMMKGMMPGGPPAGMMPGGMMMMPGGQGDHAGHHPGSSEEAEEFFKQE